MTRLTDHVKIGDAKSNLEDILFSEEIVIDAGFNLEIYGNPDGATSDSADGASLFTLVDRDVTFGELLAAVNHLGSIRDDTLTIRTVGADETVEIGLCSENPLSSTLRLPAEA